METFDQLDWAFEATGNFEFFLEESGLIYSVIFSQLYTQVQVELLHIDVQVAALNIEDQAVINPGAMFFQ
jgi:hypothetical protein